MLAFTAASSALAPVSFGRSLQRRASDRSRQLLHRTRRRMLRARVKVAQHITAVRSHF